MIIFSEGSFIEYQGQCKHLKTCGERIESGVWMAPNDGCRCRVFAMQLSRSRSMWKICIKFVTMWKLKWPTGMWRTLQIKCHWIKMVQSVQTSNNYIDLLLVRNEKKNIVKPKNSRTYRVSQKKVSLVENCHWGPLGWARVKCRTIFEKFRKFSIW